MLNILNACILFCVAVKLSTQQLKLARKYTETCGEPVTTKRSGAESTGLTGRSHSPLTEQMLIWGKHSTENGAKITIYLLLLSENLSMHLKISQNQSQLSEAFYHSEFSLVHWLYPLLRCKCVAQMRSEIPIHPLSKNRKMWHVS